MRRLRQTPLSQSPTPGSHDFQKGGCSVVYLFMASKLSRFHSLISFLDLLVQRRSTSEIHIARMRRRWSEFFPAIHYNLLSILHNLSRKVLVDRRSRTFWRVHPFFSMFDAGVIEQNIPWIIHYVTELLRRFRPGRDSAVWHRFGFFCLEDLTAVFLKDVLVWKNCQHFGRSDCYSFGR